MIALELAPLDVALVVILDDNLPSIERLLMMVRLAYAAIDERGAMLGLPIYVGACVKRVLQYRDHAAIADRRPVEAHPGLAI